jgi:hypothetical protein
MHKATPAFAVLALLFTLALTPICSAQTQLVGEWRGSIGVENQTERILWHVVKAEDGSVTSTFDNVDEGVLGIKVKTLTVDGSDVRAVIDDVIHPNGQDLHLSGTYAGKLNADGNEVTGTWTQTEPEEHPPADITFKREPAKPAAAGPQ